MLAAVLSAVVISTALTTTTTATPSLLPKLDEVVTYLDQLARKGRALPDGIGDLSVTFPMDAALHDFSQGVRAIPVADPVVLAPAGRARDGIGSADFRFPSPVAAQLPAKAATAYFRQITPPDGVRRRGVVILPGVLGESGYSWRVRRWAIPLARRGYVSLLPMPPFADDRRPDDQPDSEIRSLALLFNQIVASSIEIASLALWSLAAQDQPVLLAGTSFGGSVTTAASFLLRDIGRVGVVGFAAPDSTRPYVDSVARRRLVPHTFTMTDDELRVKMERRGLLTFQRSLPKSVTDAVRKPVVMLRGTRDAFVDAASSDRVEGALVRENGRDHVQVWSMPIGHTVAVMGPQAVFFDAIDVVRDRVLDGKPHCGCVTRRSYGWTRVRIGLATVDPDTLVNCQGTSS